MNSPPLLTIGHSYLNGVVVLTFQGAIDIATASRFRTSIEQAREMGERVILDMALVTFIDSTGVSALAEAAGVADGLQNRVKILNPSASVRRFIEITGVDAVFISPMNE